MADSTEDYLGEKNIGDLALETLLVKKPWRMSSYRHMFMMHRFSITQYTYKRWRERWRVVDCKPTSSLPYPNGPLSDNTSKAIELANAEIEKVSHLSKERYTSIYLPLIIRNPTLIRIMHVIELYGW